MAHARVATVAKNVVRANIQQRFADWNLIDQPAVKSISRVQTIALAKTSSLSSNATLLNAVIVRQKPMAAARMPSTT
jgi:hypothetical protein